VTAQVPKKPAQGARRGRQDKRRNGEAKFNFGEDHEELDELMRTHSSGFFKDGVISVNRSVPSRRPRQGAGGGQGRGRAVSSCPVRPQN
jgi:hypothetical protein